MEKISITNQQISLEKNMSFLSFVSKVLSNGLLPNFCFVLFYFALLTCVNVDIDTKTRKSLSAFVASILTSSRGRKDTINIPESETPTNFSDSCRHQIRVTFSSSASSNLHAFIIAYL